MLKGICDVHVPFVHTFDSFFPSFWQLKVDHSQFSQDNSAQHNRKHAAVKCRTHFDLLQAPGCHIYHRFMFQGEQIYPADTRGLPSPLCACCSGSVHLLKFTSIPDTAQTSVYERWNIKREGFSVRGRQRTRRAILMQTVAFLLSGGHPWRPPETRVWQKCWPRRSISPLLCWRLSFHRFLCEFKTHTSNTQRHESLTSSCMLRQRAGAQHFHAVPVKCCDKHQRSAPGFQFLELAWLFFGL